MKLKNQINTKKLLILSIVIVAIVSIILYFFLKNDYKNLEIGNTISDKTLEEIEEYILDIGSYEAKVEVTVKSNKNQNKYILSQEFTKPNISKQTVLEPSNIAGIETIYDGSTLKIYHTKLNTSTIYENYQEVCDNFLWLNTFIEDYRVGKQNNLASIEEKDGNIIMRTKVKNQDNKYTYQKELYIDRNIGKPTKLMVQDINKNTLVYILYSEIEINGLPKEKVLAFSM